MFALTAAFADDIKRIAPTGYVTDLAGVIPASTRQRLEALCTDKRIELGSIGDRICLI